MAAPKEQVGRCALEHPPWSWTMLGWGAGPRGGSLSHEVHLKDRAPQLLTSGLSDRPGAGSQVSASCLLSGTSVFTGVSPVLPVAMPFSLWEGQDLYGGAQGGGQSEAGVGAGQGVKTVGEGRKACGRSQRGEERPPEAGVQGALSWGSSERRQGRKYK